MKHNRCLYIIIPKEQQKRNIEEFDDIVALDPGIRTF